MQPEATIIINGQQLTAAQAMSLRCAMTSFLTDLHHRGLGDDEHGRTMTCNYQARGREVEAMMLEPVPVSQPTVRSWVRCPVCGESDMRHEADGEGNALITCVNHLCASNGGPNADALLVVTPAMLEVAAQAFMKADGADSVTNAQLALALKAALAARGAAVPPAVHDVRPGAEDSPLCGWTCFHCGDTFSKFASARDHFGSTPAGVPGCIIKAGDEQGLLTALRRAEAREEELRRDRDSLADQLDAAQCVKFDLLRLVPGAKTVHDVWCHLETNYSRALAAEAILAAVEKRNAELLNETRVEVCGPGTCYPISSAIPLDRPNQPLRGPIEEALKLIDAEFHTWWDDHGQYVRAGGGDYECSFAYGAWQAALKQAAFKLLVESQYIDFDASIAARKENPGVGTLAESAHAARAGATLRWVINTIGHLKSSLGAHEQPSLARAAGDLRKVLALFEPAKPVLVPSITGQGD